MPTSPSDRPTVPVPRPSPDEVRASRLTRFHRDSERLIALRAELLGMGVAEVDLEGSSG